MFDDCARYALEIAPHVMHEVMLAMAAMLSDGGAVFG